MSAKILKMALLIAMLLTILSCISAPNPNTNQQGSSPSQSNPLAIGDTTLTCDGWRLRLFKVTTNTESGWIYYDGFFALENVNATNNFNVSVLLSNLDLKMTTAEGYVYPIKPYQWDLQGAGSWVPVGFRYSGGLSYFGDKFLNKISVQAAQGSTNHLINTPCGNLDFDHPETNLIFPTDKAISSFNGFGDPITLSDGSIINLTGIDPTDKFSVKFTFTNANKGYAYNDNLYAGVIRSDGLLSISTGSVPYSVGPGQTVDEKFPLNGIDSGSLLIIADKNNNSWIINPNK